MTDELPVYAHERYIPARIRYFLLLQDDGQCLYCGLRPSSEIDHIIPLSRGGRSEPKNLVAVCWKCNARKSDRTVAEWFTDIGEAMQTALLQRFTEEDSPINGRPRPRQKGDLFLERLASLDTSGADACWDWQGREQTPHRLVYSHLREPVLPGQYLVNIRPDGCRYSQCVNPDHYLLLDKAEYRRWLRELHEKRRRERPQPE